jgi:hypothetical protein
MIENLILLKNHWQMIETLHDRLELDWRDAPRQFENHTEDFSSYDNKTSTQRQIAPKAHKLHVDMAET